MDGKEVRAMKNEELLVELKRLRAHLFKLRGQSVTEKVEDNSQFAKTRRDIARLLTEQTARLHGKSVEGKGAKPSGRRSTKRAKPAAGAKRPTPKKPRRAPHAKKKVEKKAGVKRAGARSTKKKAAGKAAKGKA